MSIDASSNDRQQMKQREFMQLLPLSMAIAGLKPNTPDNGSTPRKQSPICMSSAAATLMAWAAALA